MIKMSKKARQECIEILEFESKRSSEEVKVFVKYMKESVLGEPKAIRKLNKNVFRR